MAPKLPPLPPSTARLQPLPAAAQPASPARKPDYVVRSNDTLWSITRRFVEISTGQKPTNAQIARALVQVKAHNPQLCTAERSGGEVIRPGDPVYFPKPQALGWGVAPKK